MLTARAPRIPTAARTWTSALLAVTALTAEAPASAAPGTLTVTAVPMTMERQARSTFALDEPVWIALKVRSGDGADTTVMMRRYEPGGDLCRLVAGYHGPAVDIPGPGPVTGSVFQVRVGRADTVLAEFPLSEYVRVTDAGLVPLKCGIEVASPDGDRSIVSTTTVIRFGRSLGAGPSRRLAGTLDRLMASDDEADRLRAVRSLRSVDSTIALPLLEKAMSDSSERVQVAAAVIAVDLAGNAGARRIVDEAQRSGSQRVRQAVAAEIRWREFRARKSAPGN